MLSFNHQLACRNCMRTTGIDYRYRLNSQEQVKYQNKPEYELMLQIEKWRAADELCCDFCGSNNVEVSEIDVDGHQLYDFVSLRRKSEAEDNYLLYMKYDKTPHDTNLSVWESPNMSWPFLAEATFQIRRLLYKRPDSTFKSHPSGFFFICVLVEPALIPNESLFTVQRLSYGGINKDEILSIIEEFEVKRGRNF